MACLRHLVTHVMPCDVIGAPVTGKQELLGIEKDGYVDGGVFVISLENVDNWVQAVTQPKASSGGKKNQPKPVDPFATASLKVEFKGHGRWRVCASCILDT